MITDKIGNRIRELRSHTGLSQEKFAQKIGMDRSYFASVELGMNATAGAVTFLLQANTIKTRANSKSQLCLFINFTIRYFFI